MLEHMMSGNRKDFLHLWDTLLPDSIRNEDPVALKLEFYIHIYFAIYPLKYGQQVTFHWLLQVLVKLCISLTFFYG